MSVDFLMQFTLRQLDNHLLFYSDMLDSRTHTLLKAVAGDVLALSQDAVPILTGDLKASGHITDTWGSDKSIAIVYDAKNTSGDPYGRYVEYGTRFMGAQPFLMPAAQTAVENVAQHVDSLF
jgi:HK97 gp10 family phage protein